MKDKRKASLETLRWFQRREKGASRSHAFPNIALLSVVIIGATWFVCNGGSTCLAASPADDNVVAVAAESGPAEDSDKNQVKWLDDYDKAIVRAKKLKRPVLIDFAASWCVPCVIMKKHVWPDDAVQEALDNKVIPLRIDMDGKSAPPMIEKFKVEFVPTILLIDADELELKREGFENAKELLEMIKATKMTHDSKK